MVESVKIQQEYPVSQPKMTRILLGVLLGWGAAVLGLFTIRDFIAWLIAQWGDLFLIPAPLLFLFWGLIFGYTTFFFFLWIRVMTDPAPLELLISEGKMTISTPFKTIELPLTEIDRANAVPHSGKIQFYRFRHGASSHLSQVADIICLGYTISAQSLAEQINQALRQK